MKLRLFTALLIKEFLLEMRSKELVTIMGTLSILIAVLCGFAVGGAFLDLLTTERIFPLLLWLGFLFAGTLTLGRAHDHDLADGAAEGLLLAGAPAWALYLAKVIAIFAILVPAQLFMTVLIAGMIDIPISSRFPALIGITVLVVLAYVLVAVLLSALTSASKLRGVLLPLILLPLLTPLFFAALELTAMALNSGTIDLSSPWVGVLTILNLIYLVSGLTLYRTTLLD